MPVNIIRPTAIGNVDTLTLGAGANKIVAVDSGDPVGHDDNTSYLEGENAAATSYKLTGNPAAPDIGKVNSYKLGIRANNQNEGNCSERIYARSGTTDGTVTATVTGTGYQTAGPNNANRPGGGNWVPADFVENDNTFQFKGLINGNAIVALPRITTLWGELDFKPPAGGFALHVSQWLPPILAVASHCLSKLEIAQILARLDSRPSEDEDFARILEAFRRRPAFVLVGAGR